MDCILVPLQGKKEIDPKCPLINDGSIREYLARNTNITPMVRPPIINCRGHKRIFTYGIENRTETGMHKGKTARVPFVPRPM